jgi:hypothetical protein
VPLPGYLIHIGPHKTGTTYLQHAFTRLRPELAARGICYPPQWGGDHGHHQLAEQISARDDAALEAEFARLNHSSAETILLSSETLSYFGDNDVRRLHALLGGNPATVVFYCRRWSELIPSSWREMVKHGSLMTMPEFVLSCLADPAASPLVNFAHVLGRYAAVFGPANLRLVSYNGVLEASQDLMTHFCRSFLAWPNPPSSGSDRVNESLNMVDSEIIRALNALEWTRAREQRQRFYRHFLAAKATLPVRWLVQNAMQYTVESLCIDDAADALARLHAGILEQYRDVLVAPSPGGLFEPRASQVRYVRTDYVMAPGVLETLRDMQTKLLAAGPATA